MNSTFENPSYYTPAESKYFVLFFIYSEKPDKSRWLLTLDGVAQYASKVETGQTADEIVKKEIPYITGDFQYKIEKMILYDTAHDKFGNKLPRYAIHIKIPYNVLAENRAVLGKTTRWISLDMKTQNKIFKLAFSITEIVNSFNQGEIIKFGDLGYIVNVFKPSQKGLNPITKEELTIPERIEPVYLDPKIYLNISEYLRINNIKLKVLDIANSHLDLKTSLDIRDSQGESIGILRMLVLPEREIRKDGILKLIDREISYSIRFSKDFIISVKEKCNFSYEITVVRDIDLEDRRNITNIIKHC